MKIFLETERLILREIVDQDEAALFELDSDPEVHKYVGKKPIENIELIKMVIAFIRQQYEDNGIGRWAVIEKKSNQLIGWAGLKLFTDEINGQLNFYELGYRFMTKHWGKGYATESAKAIVAYGFNILNLNDIYAMIDVKNTPSKKVLEKTGFKFVDIFEFNDEPTEWYKLSH